MTQEDYIEMKKGYMQFVIQFMTKHGGLGPSITVLGTHKEDGKNAIVHVPIPEKFMKTDEAKDEFVDEIVPEIAKKVAQDFTTSGVAWASEAWLRVLEKDKATPEQLENWKDLPIKKEVLIVSIESDNGNETYIREIVRKGKQVNEDGELVDHIELLELPGYDEGVQGEGRFIGLYQKFKRSSADL